MDSTPAETHDELLARAREYAETVDLPVDLSAVRWEVSTRAKRRAGACLYDRGSGTTTIRLARAAYRAYGWDRFAEVIRHELIHAWEYQRFGESSHGPRFRRKAADLDVSVRCPRFSAGRLRLVCTDPACDWTAERHRASATVTEPERRRCGSCRAPYEVRHVASGLAWRTAAGYRRARERLGDEW
ncbi:SprT-like domain-containing protein [Halegenticoccus tardaugens]|uniref:SprT-like domain-containing protein n=1 Tax=Halegenticoccus tardaugens TaxID=2071624 RepID=UPI00100A61D3|nr:SprT-like domain-containing protein [Halegenticoccus tardaugens]